VLADDNLDVTASSPLSGKTSEVASIPAPKKEDSTKSKIPGLAASSTETEGLSVMQKILFIGAVIAVCVVFLRTRGGNGNSTGGFKEKSMA